MFSLTLPFFRMKVLVLLKYAALLTALLMMHVVWRAGFEAMSLMQRCIERIPAVRITCVLIIALLAGVPTQAMSAGADCEFSAAANQPPRIPKRLVLAEQFQKLSETQARFSALLKTGVILLSTHTAYENYGANVVLIIPDDEYIKTHDLRKDMQEALGWYIGDAAAKHIFSFVGQRSIQPGWKADLSLAGSSEGFDSFSVKTFDVIDGYIVVEFSYYGSS